MSRERQAAFKQKRGKTARDRNEKDKRMKGKGEKGREGDCTSEKHHFSTVTFQNSRIARKEKNISKEE